jgi:hypothetical protein
LSLGQLLSDWVSADADVRDAEMSRREIENDITIEFRRLEQESLKEGVAPPTFASAPGVEATFKPTVTWMKSLDGPLAMLGEVIDPSEISGYLTPVKPPPPRTFNMTAVKPLERRGGVYAKAIAAARTTLPAEVKMRSVNTQQ